MLHKHVQNFSTSCGLSSVHLLCKIMCWENEYEKNKTLIHTHTNMHIKIKCTHTHASMPFDHYMDYIWEEMVVITLNIF